MLNMWLFVTSLSFDFHHEPSCYLEHAIFGWVLKMGHTLKMAFLMREMMTEAQPERTNLEFFVFKTHVELQFIVGLFHVMDKALEFGYPEAGCLHS